MRRYEFQLVFLNRVELRTDGPSLARLNELGSQGWHIVHIREDPQHATDLAIFMEREVA
jgi:hypothetical protein